MVVCAGKIAYSYGDPSRASCLASVRKSILSMLYGRYVTNGQIDLNRTIGEIGVDEAGEGLLPIEESATIKHPLMSSSGIYWPAGSSGETRRRHLADRRSPAPVSGTITGISVSRELYSSN
jgi:CubicO group peptidase (beta-lactamase class C family)